MKVKKKEKEKYYWTSSAEAIRTAMRNLSKEVKEMSKEILTRPCQERKKLSCFFECVNHSVRSSILEKQQPQSETGGNQNNNERTAIFGVGIIRHET